MDIFIFASEQWLLISIMLILIYALVWRESQKGGKTVSIHELTRLINSDEGLVLDVRDSKDYNAGHIAGAVNIPYAKIGERLAELESQRDKLIIIVDKLGQHAGTVGRTLSQHHYQVNRLSGGMSSWEAEKLPMVKK